MSALCSTLFACSGTQGFVYGQQSVAPCLLRYTGTSPLSAMCSILLSDQVHRDLPTVSIVQQRACSGTQVLVHCQHCAALCFVRYTGTCPLSALCSIFLAQVHRYLPTVSTVQHLACSGTHVLTHCQHCAIYCLFRYTGTCPLSALCSILLAQVHRYLPNVCTVHYLALSGTQVLAHCHHCAAYCLLRYTGTCPLSALCSTLLAQVHRYLPNVSTVHYLALSGTQVLAHCQQCAVPCFVRYTGTCPLSSLCSILLAHVHRYLPTVSTVQYLACSDTQVLAHCQHCAAPCLLRYTGTCPLSAFCSSVLAQVHRDLPTVSNVQHLACSGSQVLAHCQHCAEPCFVRYTGTCPLSALCNTLFAQVQRYFPTVSTVQHLALSGTQVLAHSQHCATLCLFKYIGTCALSALCSTLLAQVQRYLPAVSTVQHLACSGTQVLAHCHHCAAPCLLRYTGTCPLSSLCSNLFVQVHRFLPTVSTVQHLTCSDTQVLAHCQYCAAPCLLRYTGTCPLSALCSSVLAQVHRDLPSVSNLQHLAWSSTQVLAHCQLCAAPCFFSYTGTCPLSALCNTLLA
jgi:phosphatidylethanolamine-binding protein (PEBP) family uncharacterized protein